MKAMSSIRGDQESPDRFGRFCVQRRQAIELHPQAAALLARLEEQLDLTEEDSDTVVKQLTLYIDHITSSNRRWNQRMATYFIAMGRIDKEVRKNFLKRFLT